MKNAEAYLEKWWIFGKPRQNLRPVLAGLPRYIATVETSKHRVFQFLDASILPDNMLVNIGSADAFHLGVLSSLVHGIWVTANAGSMGIYIGNVRYTKSRCFDPFPFPEATESQRAAIGAIAEEIDDTRKRVLAEHPHLTLTGLYNLRDKLRAGADPNSLQGEDRRCLDDGLVLILDELHRALDRAVAEAYGWPDGLSDAAILANLVDLNRARTGEEARGAVRWLRPDYQIPRFGSTAQKLDLAGGNIGARAAPAERRAWPADEVAQTAEIMAALAAAPTGLAAAELAPQFKGRALRPKIETILAGLLRLGLITQESTHYHLRRVA